MSSLFKSKGGSSTPTSPQFKTLYDPFKETREKTNTWLASQVGQPGPKYEGERVAPTSDIENASLDYAREYATKPNTGASFAAAQEEIKKTLSGDYDPSTSPYYQAVKAEAQKNLEDQSKFIADRSAGAGRYYSGARIRAQANAAAETTRGLNTQLGQLAENERVRRLQSVPLALQADAIETGADAKKAQNLQLLGALPRELEQALMDAAYQQFVSENYEYPLNIAQLAVGPSQQQPVFVQQGYSPYRGSTASGLAALLNI